MTEAAPPLSLTLSIPGDVRFRVTASGVTQRVAWHIGRPEDEAHRIGEVVDTVIAAVIEHAFRGRASDIDIRFLASPSRLEIRIGYETEAAGRLEGALRANGGAFDAIRRLIDRVEFGRSAGHDFCLLTEIFRTPPEPALHHPPRVSRMRLYNTLTRQEEEFAPRLGNQVRMYTCGLTVYARGHIGNFRTFVCVDVLRRVLKYQHGFDVRQVMNYTDVDDRTIAEAQKEGVPLREYTDRHIAAFEEDAKTLGLERAEETPRATDETNLRAMCQTIGALEANGHTYVSDGSIYFRISTWPEYGKLSRLDHAGIQDGARIDSDKYAKENARDFVLWKATKEGEPTWDCNGVPGRPGWHIECSAMALRLLGDPPIDLHAGGVDLIFPHHENEIAQSEGATRTLFSRFWFHVEFLLVDEGEKMSKSLGNVYTVPDVLAAGHRASALRYLLLSVHYRKQLKFNWSSLGQAEEALKRLMDFLARLDTVTAPDGHPATAGRVAAARAGFAAALDDDLNTAGALGEMFELVRVLNAAIDAGELGRPDVPVVREAFDHFDKVLGIVSLRRAEEAKPPVPVEEIDRLVEERQDARRRRDFAAADHIRRELEERGVLLEDGAAGTRWKLK